MGSLHPLATALVLVASAFWAACFTDNGGAATSVAAPIASDGGANRFFEVAREPAASFGLSVGTASFHWTRALVQRGELPRPADVRLEEFVNSVAFADRQPGVADTEPFDLTLEAAPTPMDATILLRVGVRAAPGTAFAADEVSVRVTFNDAHVRAYRLLGYDNAATTAEPSPVTAGDGLTVLYELVAAGAALPGPVSADSGAEPTDAARPAARAPAVDELVSVELSYRATDASADGVVRAGLRVDAVHPEMDAASSDLQFAMTIVAFAEILKESPYASRYGASAILRRMSRHTLGAPDRLRMLDLVRQTFELLPQLPDLPQGS